MYFRDECEIRVSAGKGGDGLVSFHREKFVQKGGPDGGDGGKGGDVVLVATERSSSLLYIGRKPIYRARDGRPGGPRNRAGANGDDLTLEVPRGTLVLDARRGHVLRDLVDEGDSVVIAKGGHGGQGNARFATAVRQAPRKATPGGAGEERELRLELKMFAEVGLVGLPNAGKSTFLAAVSAATPKIADYPFTTLNPQVGIAPVANHETLCVADLPGLIEGAADGVGLGHRFLRHVERCRVLLLFVDVSSSATTEPEEALATVAAELGNYSEELRRRPRLLVATKCEEPEAEERVRALEAAAGESVWRISSHTHQGLQELLAAARDLVRGEGVPERLSPALLSRRHPPGSDETGRGTPTGSPPPRPPFWRIP